MQNEMLGRMSSTLVGKKWEERCNQSDLWLRLTGLRAEIRKSLDVIISKWWQNCNFFL